MFFENMPHRSNVNNVWLFPLSANI